MFIFDFVAETVLDQIIDWLYGKIVGFLNDFFAMMNNMGVELFDLPWVNAITTFFSWLGWALFVVGLVVGAFECAIEYQGGRGSIKDIALNYVKGFMAVSLFSILPVNLYSLSVSLQSSFGRTSASASFRPTLPALPTSSVSTMCRRLAMLISTARWTR